MILLIAIVFFYIQQLKYENSYSKISKDKSRQTAFAFGRNWEYKELKINKKDYTMIVMD